MKYIWLKVARIEGYEDVHPEILRDDLLASGQDWPGEIEAFDDNPLQARFAELKQYSAAATEYMLRMDERIAKLEQAVADSFDPTGYYKGDPEYDIWEQCYRKCYPESFPEKQNNEEVDVE